MVVGAIVGLIRTLRRVWMGVCGRTAVIAIPA
jgi:hypothetical protein